MKPISTKDRLPKDFEEVVFYYNDKKKRFIATGFYEGLTKKWVPDVSFLPEPVGAIVEAFLHFNRKAVTHWLPLPKTVGFEDYAPYPGGVE